VTRTANHGPTSPAVVLDLATVVTVLYVGPFTLADWHHLGPAALAGYVVQVAADPRTRIRELAALLAVAKRSGLVGLNDTASQHLAAAEKYAPTVLAAATTGAR
jgi:hypothetical protein